MVAAGMPVISVILYPLMQQLEGGLDRRAVAQFEFAEQKRVGTLGVGDDRAVADAIPPQLILRVEAAFFLGHFGAHEHAKLVVRRIEVDQLSGIGIARQKFAVIQPHGDDLVDQGEQQRAVGAGPDRHPLVGDGRIAGAHRVDRNEFAAVALEF
ncbi:MAG: hypothetical protein FD134_2070 [Gallionellaceae bacterium]|nr:MAG: hypothetical protein FD134_2070 [Gallionellaceae bacterium]